MNDVRATEIAKPSGKKVDAIVEVSLAVATAAMNIIPSMGGRRIQWIAVRITACSSLIHDRKRTSGRIDNCIHSNVAVGVYDYGSRVDTEQVLKEFPGPERTNDAQN
ncbi:MAG: hypothetical protein ABW187_07355, partial [Dokdonella sp.]